MLLDNFSPEEDSSINDLTGTTAIIITLKADSRPILVDKQTDRAQFKQGNTINRLTSNRIYIRSYEINPDKDLTTICIAIRSLGLVSRPPDKIPTFPVVKRIQFLQPAEKSIIIFLEKLMMQKSLLNSMPVKIPSAANLTVSSMKTSLSKNLRAGF
ncbi:hypothetical protein P3339_03645 [Microbulbifer sp. MLAF003]|uniref:hypothetical protein n=1 Tax=Microbulbifer TaxID=48073 RepID=UPI00037FBF3E|nr:MULTISPECIES: hypothetical protein [Microbulbifer]WHI51932.1 hypothetical protein P3339_03645 [Microbulbifer sp. MLAF003]